MCDSQNISFAALEREIGLANSSIRKWDTNAPSVDKAQKVADYFGVTIEYLIGRTDDPHGTAELTKEEQKIFDALMKGRASKNPAIRIIAESLSKALDIDGE